MNGARRLGLLRRSAVAAGVLGVLVAAPAHGDPEWVPNPPPDKAPCVASSELRELPRHEGWSRAKVERWTETRGLGDRMETPELTYYGYWYPGCRPGARVVVYFRTLDDTLAAVHD